MEWDAGPYYLFLSEKPSSEAYSLGVFIPGSFLPTEIYEKRSLHWGGNGFGRE